MGVPNHQPNDCLLDHLFGGRSKKTLNLRFTGLCVENSPVTGEFPAQMASNAENVSIWWRRHGKHSYLYGNVQYNEISYIYENVYYERKVLFISVYSSWRTVSTIRWGWLNMPKSLGMSIRRTEKKCCRYGNAHVPWPPFMHNGNPHAVDQDSGFRGAWRVNNADAMGLLPDTQNCGLRMCRECRERFPRHRLRMKPQISDPGLHYGTCVKLVGIANPRWHFRRMRNPQFYVSGKRPIGLVSVLLCSIITC